MRTLLAVVFLFMLAIPAQADTLYTYTSDGFTLVQGVYQPGDRITGWFVLSDQFVGEPYVSGDLDVTPYVLSYSFTDGQQTLTQDNSSIVPHGFRVGFSNGVALVPSIKNGGFTVDLRASTSGISILVLQEYNIAAWLNSSTYPATHRCNDNTALCFDDQNVDAMKILSSDNRAEGNEGTWTMEAIPARSVTEPSSLALLPLGLIGIVVAGKYRKRLG